MHLISNSPTDTNIIQHQTSAELEHQNSFHDINIIYPMLTIVRVQRCMCPGVRLTLAVTVTIVCNQSLYNIVMYSSLRRRISTKFIYFHFDVLTFYLCC